MDDIVPISLGDRPGGKLANTNDTNEIRRAVNTLGQLHLPLPPRRQEQDDGGGVWAKVTTNAAAGGVYNGKRFIDATSSLDPTANASNASVGTLPDSEDCYVVNMAEKGKSTHAITLALTMGWSQQDAFPGTLRATAASDGKPVILIYAIVTKDCA